MREGYCRHCLPAYHHRHPRSDGPTAQVVPAAPGGAYYGVATGVGAAVPPVPGAPWGGVSYLLGSNPCLPSAPWPGVAVAVGVVPAGGEVPVAPGAVDWSGATFWRPVVA